MNQSDAYYRALLAYRALVGAKRECVRDSRALVSTEGTEKIKTVRAHCTVDEEWIREIEKGLVYVEKAIKEERQFIYSNGEVIPIEKVKNVSKDSVQHLARHSDLITRVPEENHDLIPDKLYTVERYSDYTVYENRFLYMLLCYLRDFVTLRYQKILDLTNRYEGELTVQKDVTVFNRTMELRIDLHDIRRDDPYLREHNPAKGLIDRIDLILKTVMSFLATPLMESVEKAPMLKPPITKTNVLKMDNNFKGAVALYEYIISYSGEGFTVEEQIHEIEPFREDLADEMAEAELLLSFLTYRYGLDLTDELKATYELEEANRRRAELQARIKQMDDIRRRLAAKEESPEAYILHLEKLVRSLQNEADRLGPLYAEWKELKENEHALHEEIATLSEQFSQLEQEFEAAKLAHADELQAMAQAHRGEIAALCEAHRQEINELHERYTAQIGELNEQHQSELTALHEQHGAEISELTEKYTAEINTLHEQWQTQVSGLREDLQTSQSEIVRLTSENTALSDEQKVLRARILALRNKRGEVDPAEKDAMTEKERFDELEEQLEAFVRFYKDEWALTKRKIRKDLLNMKYIKGQSGKE